MGFTLTEEELEKILRQFDRLSALLVDSSSLIQIEKAGFLSLLSREVRLFTLSQVREEYLRGGPLLSFPEDVQILPSPSTLTGMAPRRTADCAPLTDPAAFADSHAPNNKATRKAFDAVPATAPTDEAIHEARDTVPATPSTDEAIRLPFNAVPATAPATASTDEVLLAVARARRLPLLSEDRKLLLKAEGLGLEYYNALMMLEFLQYRGASEPIKKPLTAYQPLDFAMQKHRFAPSPGQSDLSVLSEFPPFDYPTLKQRLLTQSRYSREVRRYADQLHTFIEKVGG